MPRRGPPAASAKYHIFYRCCKISLYTEENYPSLISSGGWRGSRLERFMFVF